MGNKRKDRKYTRAELTGLIADFCTRWPQVAEGVISINGGAEAGKTVTAQILCDESLRYMSEDILFEFDDHELDSLNGMLLELKSIHGEVVIPFPGDELGWETSQTDLGLINRYGNIVCDDFQPFCEDRP